MQTLSLISIKAKLCLFHLSKVRIKEDRSPALSLYRFKIKSL